jgi:hypothetical protein
MRAGIDSRQLSSPKEALRDRRREPYCVATLIVERKVRRFRAWFNCWSGEAVRSRRITARRSDGMYFAEASRTPGRVMTAVVPSCYLLHGDHRVLVGCVRPHHVWDVALLHWLGSIFADTGSL